MVSDAEKESYLVGRGLIRWGGDEGWLLSRKAVSLLTGLPTERVGEIAREASRTNGGALSVNGITGDAARDLRRGGAETRAKFGSASMLDVLFAAAQGGTAFTRSA